MCIAVRLTFKRFENRENQTATSNNNKYTSACNTGWGEGGVCEDERKEEHKKKSTS